MPRKSSGDKLKALLQRRTELDAQIQAVAARQKDEQRRMDTRRKIIVGALAIEHMEANPKSDFAAMLTRLMDEYVTRAVDRALFTTLPKMEQSSEGDRT